MMLSLISCYCVFPSIIDQILGKKGNQGLAFLGAYTQKNFAERLHECSCAISKDFFNSYISIFIVIICILIISKIFFCVFNIKVTKDFCIYNIEFSIKPFPRKVKINLGVTFIYKAMIAFSSVAYFLVVTKIAPFLEPRYFYIIYPLLAIIIVDILYNILLKHHQTKINLLLFYFAFTCLIFFNIQQYSPNNLHFADPFFSKIANNSLNEHINVIEINKNKSWWPIIPQYKIFNSSPFSCLITDDNLLLLSEKIKNMPGRKDKFILIKSFTSSIKENTIIDFIIKNSQYNNYKKIGNFFGDIYCFYKK